MLISAGSDREIIYISLQLNKRYIYKSIVETLKEKRRRVFGSKNNTLLLLDRLKTNAFLPNAFLPSSVVHSLSRKRKRKRKRSTEMKNSSSNRSLYMESDEEDGREKNDGNDSDSSNYSDDSPNSNPNSYNPAWPQSYRYLSIHLYSGWNWR